MDICWTSCSNTRLSLKNEFDENILEIDLPTNEDVTIDYKEDDVPGDTKHDAHCPAVQLTVKRVNIIVEKIWDDGNNVDGIRPESVQIQLYADGTASGSPITLNKDNNWKYTFSGLPRLNDNGSEIKYTIVELNVPGNYTATVTGDMTKGFVVKNYHKPDEVPPTPIPQTGETSKIVIGSAMILLTGIACYSLVLSKKKQN